MCSKSGKCGTFWSRIGGSVTHNVGAMPSLVHTVKIAVGAGRMCTRLRHGWIVAGMRSFFRRCDVDKQNLLVERRWLRGGEVHGLQKFVVRAVL